MLFAGDGAFWLAQTGRVGLTAQSPVSDRFPRAGAQQLNLWNNPTGFNQERRLWEACKFLQQNSHSRSRSCLQYAYLPPSVCRALDVNGRFALSGRAEDWGHAPPCKQENYVPGVEERRLFHKSKKKRLETMACIEKKKGRGNAGEAFGAVSAGGGRMRLWAAFKNELLGSHEWCGGFPFIHPPLQLWQGTSVSPEPRQQSVAAACCAQSPAHLNQQPRG